MTMMILVCVYQGIAEDGETVVDLLCQRVEKMAPFHNGSAGASNLKRGFLKNKYSHKANRVGAARYGKKKKKK